MTQPPFPAPQTPDLTPLVPGTPVGDYRVLALTGQEGVRGYTVQRYQVEAARPDSAQEPLQLRRILPPPPSARTEAEWLAAVQSRPETGELRAFDPALAAWSDPQASYLVGRPREGQHLQQYLAAHPPLPPYDGELLARGLLGAAASLHSAGLHLPQLTPAQVWLDRSGEVGLHDLWAALGEGSVGGDLHQIGDLLRGAVQPPATGTPLDRLLRALSAPAGYGLPISAQAALRLLDRPAATDTPAAPPHSPAAVPPQTATTQPPPPQPAPAAARPLWPWLLPVAALLLGGIATLEWPQLQGALHSGLAPTASGTAADNAARPPATAPAGPAPTSGTAPEASGAAQLMTLPATLNLRPSADPAGAPLAAIPSRTLLPVLSQKGDWYKVRYGKLTGWVSGQYILPVLGPGEVQALTQAATRGGTVNLARGVYLLHAPLDLRWDTELVGQGREQTYLLGDSGDHVLSSRDVHLTLSRLTVAWNGQSPGQAVLVERGTLTAEEVWLTGGIPDGAQRARGSGLWLRAGAQAQITGSLFSRNAIGISAEDSRLNLTASQLGNNRFAGAVFSGQASGEVRSNLLDANAEDGIIVTGSASPLLTDNHIKSSGQRGLEIVGSAAPTVQNNRIEGGQYSVSVGGQAAPQLRGNALSGASEGGLIYRSQAAGTAEGNTVSGTQTGIQVSESAAPALRSNQLLGLRGDGLVYSSAAGGEASKNVIRDVGGSGITLSGQASPLLEGNHISGGRQSGVVVEGQSQARLQRNTVEAQAQHGAVVAGEAAPVLEQNAFLHNGGYGLVYKEAAGGSGERNLCQNNRAGPALLKLDPSVYGPVFGRDGCLGSATGPAPVPQTLDGTAPAEPATGEGSSTATEETPAISSSAGNVPPSSTEAPLPAPPSP